MIRRCEAMKLSDFKLHSAFCFAYLNAFLFENLIAETEQHGICTDDYKGDDKVPHRSDCIGERRPRIEEIAAERQLEQGVECEVQADADPEAQDPAQHVASRFELDETFLELSCEDEAGQKTEAGIIVGAFAEEPSRHGGKHQNRVEYPAALDLFLQERDEEDDDCADQPAGDHVGGIMYAESDAGETDQQWENDPQERHPYLVFRVQSQGSVHGHRFGCVDTGERITLRRNIVDISFAVDCFEAFDPFVIKIRSAPQDDILDHTAQRYGEQQVQSYMLAELLVPAPVQKADDRHTDQILAEHGERRGYRDADCTDP